MKFGLGSGGPRWEVGWFYKIILINCSPHPPCSFPGPGMVRVLGAGQRCMITAGGCCTRTLAAAADGFIICRTGRGLPSTLQHCSTAAPLQSYLVICTKQRRAPVSSDFAFILVQIFWLILNWGQGLQKIIELNQNIHQNKSLNLMSKRGAGVILGQFVYPVYPVQCLACLKCPSSGGTIPVSHNSSPHPLPPPALARVSSPLLPRLRDGDYLNTAQPNFLVLVNPAAAARRAPPVCRVSEAEEMA